MKLSVTSKLFIVFFLLLINNIVLFGQETEIRGIHQLEHEYYKKIVTMSILSSALLP